MKDFDQLAEQFDLTSSDKTFNEADLTIALASRIAELLDGDPDILFSTLYRLDVEEHRINHVIKSSEDTALGLAKLVVSRQKQKLATRNEYRQNDGPDTFDFLED